MEIDIALNGHRRILDTMRHPDFALSRAQLAQLQRA